MTPPKMKLYEFSAMLTVHTVVAAKSEDAAKAKLDSFSREWWAHQNANADVICVSDLDLFDVRDQKPHVPISEQAHLVVG